MKQDLLKQISEIKNKMKNMSNVEKMVVEHFELIPLYIALGKLISESEELI